MINNDIYLQLSKELDIPVDVIKRAYIHYWKFIKESIKALPLKEDLTEEEFLKLRTNFNIPSLGKLYCTYENVLNTKKQFKIVQDVKNKKDKADVHGVANNNGQI